MANRNMHDKDVMTNLNNNRGQQLGTIFGKAIMSLYLKIDRQS